MVRRCAYPSIHFFVSRSRSVVDCAHIQAFTFSSQDHGRLSIVRISKHSPFSRRRHSQDHGRLSGECMWRVWCVGCVWCVVVVCCGGVWWWWCVVKLGTLPSLLLSLLPLLFPFRFPFLFLSYLSFSLFSFFFFFSVLVLQMINDTASLSWRVRMMHLI